MHIFLDFGLIYYACQAENVAKSKNNENEC